MRRRDFITLMGGAAAGWSLTARAQQSGKVPRISFLSPSSLAGRLESFRQGLHDFGYVEGMNIAIEYRWPERHYERLPELVDEIVRANVELIVTRGTPGSLAAKKATTTIPIVVALTGDPITSGIVANVARPGGNITGQSFFNADLRAKRVELLKELMPNLTEVAAILDSDNPAAESEFQTWKQARNRSMSNCNHSVCGRRARS